MPRPQPGIFLKAEVCHVPSEKAEAREDVATPTSTSDEVFAAGTGKLTAKNIFWAGALCGKRVNRLGMNLGKIRVWLSTSASQDITNSWIGRVKHDLIHTTVQLFSPGLSPLKIAASPLTEHYFYPVSTVPTNNYNQRELKKGNK